MALLDPETLRRAHVPADLLQLHRGSGFCELGECRGDPPRVSVRRGSRVTPGEGDNVQPPVRRIARRTEIRRGDSGPIEKVNVALIGRPTMITVRGRRQERDGRIPTDSTRKLMTASCIAATDGKRRPAVGPSIRTTSSPRCCPTRVRWSPSDGSIVRSLATSRFVGVRRYVMINWMASTFAARRDLPKHRVFATAERAFARAETA
jgi:hypothetical protein